MLMRTILYGTAAFMVVAVGCSRNATPSKKEAGVEPAKTTAAPTVVDSKLVTLKVEGMV